MTARTVRDVLVEHLGPDVADALAELRTVLSTGDQWITREIEARHLVAGDVLRAKDGGLWAVSDVGSAPGEIVITRAGAVKAMSLPPDRLIPALLTRTDARALALLEAELGASTVGREVA